MSKLETITIDTPSGSNTMQIGSTNTATINLGVSGDTINVPAGVTIANAGTATGFGEANNPSFFAYMSAHQSVSDNVNTKVAFNTALFATSGTYDTSNYRFTPGVAGNYQFSIQVVGDSQATANLYANSLYLFKNGSGLGSFRAGEVNNNYVDNYPRQHAISLNIAVQSDADDYFEVYAATNDTSGTPQFFSYGSCFGAFRIGSSA